MTIKTPKQLAKESRGAFEVRDGDVQETSWSFIRGVIADAITADRAQRAETRVYAAVIEWPEPISDADPSLILATTVAERSAEIIGDLRETADMLTDPEWREVLAGIDSVNWADYTEVLENTRYGSPYITTYEREIPA